MKLSPIPKKVLAEAKSGSFSEVAFIRQIADVKLWSFSEEIQQTDQFDQQSKRVSLH